MVGEAADSMLRGKDFLLGLALESWGPGLGRVFFFHIILQTYRFKLKFDQGRMTELEKHEETGGANH